VPLQDGQVTESKPARGPDFLPYPLPNRDVAPAAAVVPELPVGSRWERALEGLTTWGMTSISFGIIALACLLGRSLPGHRSAGALLASLSAVVSVGAAVKALSEEQPNDSRSLVKGGAGLAVGSALIALLLLATHRSATAEQPPVQLPVPPPTSQPQPQPQQPTPTPSLPSRGVPTPGPSGSPGAAPTPGNGLGSDVFGVPSEPGGSPVSDDPTAKGTLTGRVVNLSGAAVAGATITITRTDPSDVSDSAACPLRLTTTTNAQGSYMIQLCQLGNDLGYHVVITSGTARSAGDLFVNSGQETVFSVILPIRRA
jgi:hypothetical protein